MAVIDTAKRDQLKALIIAYMTAQFGTPDDGGTSLDKFALAMANAIQEWSEIV